jgi:uncharacterized Tic20 family protein
MIADEIERLHALKVAGTLTAEQFERAKEQILTAVTGTDGERICGIGVNAWCALMHLSQMLWWTGAGIVAPIAMWIVGRQQSRLVDLQGRIIINWMISSLIYGLVSGMLVFVAVGVPMLAVLGILTMILPLIGALRAAEGYPWRYWLSLEFLATEEELPNELPY